MTLEEGIEFYAEGIKLREEERLYSFWEQLKTSIGGHEVPPYNTFLKEVMGTTDTVKEEKTSKQRLGALKGDDITR